MSHHQWKHSIGFTQDTGSRTVPLNNLASADAVVAGRTRSTVIELARNLLPIRTNDLASSCRSESLS
jgi:hypothetical protein